MGGLVSAKIELGLITNKFKIKVDIVQSLKLYLNEKIENIVYWTKPFVRFVCQKIKDLS